MNLCHGTCDKNVPVFAIDNSLGVFECSFCSPPPPFWRQRVGVEDAEVDDV